MATTTNFGWETPDDTDLVKDGAAAIRTALGGVDTSFVDLKGGTTGQILSKASNTDLDYTWVTTDDANAIQNAIVDAKGDIVAASAADTPARLAVGNNGETLVADSSTSTGLRWQVPVNVNPILNSNFTIWQRGTSFAAPAAGSYLADRWNVGNSGAAGRTYSRQTASLDGFQYCIRGQRDSGNTGTGIISFSQSLETVNSIPYQGKTITVSFYARKGADYSAASSALAITLATGTGTDQKRLIGDPATYTGNSSVISSSVTLTTSWQRFTATATLATTATEIAFGFQHTPVGTAGAADYFEVTGAMLEVGNVATPFQTNQPTLATELAACQRYYYKTFAQGTAPAQNAGAVGAIQVPQVVTGAVNQTVTNVRFPVTMRATPTVTIFNTQAANAQFRNANGGVDWSSSVVEAAGDSGVSFQGTGNAAGNAGNRCVFHFTAEIEL